MEEMNESEAVLKLAQHLKKRGFKLLKPLKVRGRIPDIVAVKDDEIFLFEVKGSRGDMLKGIAQALHYSHCGNYSYLAAPEDGLNKDIISSSKKLGIGIFSIGIMVRELVSPQRKDALTSVKSTFLSRRNKKEPKYKFFPKLKKSTFPLDEILESKGMLKVLRVLCNNPHPELDFTITEISKEGRVDKAIVSKTVAKLEKNGLIKSYYRGNLKLCKLNMTHDLFDALVALFAKERYVDAKSRKWLT